MSEFAWKIKGKQFQKAFETFMYMYVTVFSYSKATQFFTFLFAEAVTCGSELMETQETVLQKLQ
jgi:hypothetical protein